MKPIRSYSFIMGKRFAPNQVIILKTKVEAPLEPAMLSPNQVDTSQTQNAQSDSD